MLNDIQNDPKFGFQTHHSSLFDEHTRLGSQRFNQFEVTKVEPYKHPSVFRVLISLKFELIKLLGFSEMNLPPYTRGEPKVLNFLKLFKSFEKVLKNFI